MVMLVNEKSALSSKTIWGALIAIVPQVLSLFGFELADGIMNDVVSVMGGVLAIYGRVDAGGISGVVKKT